MEITSLNIPDMINTTELRSNTLENNVILGKTPQDTTRGSNGECDA